MKVNIGFHIAILFESLKLRAVLTCPKDAFYMARHRADHGKCGQSEPGPYSGVQIATHIGYSQDYG